MCIMDEMDKKENEISKLECASECADGEKKRNREISFEFGLCNKCVHFLFIEFELGDYMAYCKPGYDTPSFKRTPQHKVIKCNTFGDRNFKSIRELYDMATFIDIKEKVGFGR